MVAPCPTKNGGTSCPPWRLYTSERNLQLESKDLRPPRQCRWTLAAIWALLGLHRIRRPGLVSCWPVSSRVIITPSINILSVTACCKRRMECLSASGKHIYTEYQQIVEIVALVLSPSLKVLVKIIQLLFVHVCCIFYVVFSVLY